MKKEPDYILQYEDLTAEMYRTWKAKTKVIPVNRGIWNHLTIRQYLRNILGKHEIKELQKTVILGTAHILRKVQNIHNWK